MNQLSFGFPKNYFSANENASLEEKISWFESFGFDYFIDWHEKGFHLPERIKIPSGQILSIDEINNNLTRLDFGNRNQITLLQALEYWDLLDDEDYDRFEGRSSFEDSNDELVCRNKYSKPKSFLSSTHS
jgi:hypothetical protein